MLEILFAAWIGIGIGYAIGATRMKNRCVRILASTQKMVEGLREDIEALPPALDIPRVQTLGEILTSGVYALGRSLVYAAVNPNGSKVFTFYRQQHLEHQRMQDERGEWWERHMLPDQNWTAWNPCTLLEHLHEPA